MCFKGKARKKGSRDYQSQETGLAAKGPGLLWATPASRWIRRKQNARPERNTLFSQQRKERGIDAIAHGVLSNAVYDIVIYNRKYIFGLCPITSAQSSSNPGTFLRDKSNKGVFCHVAEV